MAMPADAKISIIKLSTIIKENKYKYLETEIEKMRYLKTTTVPVIVGALGMIKKVTDWYINTIPNRPTQ